MLKDAIKKEHAEQLKTCVNDINILEECLFVIAQMEQMVEDHKTDFTIRTMPKDHHCKIENEIIDDE